MICKRCGEEFEKEPNPLDGKPYTCCVQCRFRNLMDGLGMPTPPEMLDPFTRIPTLTKSEYDRLVENMPEEGYEKAGD